MNKDLILALLEKELIIQAHIHDLDDMGMETSRLFLDLGDIIIEFFDLPNNDDVLSRFYDIVFGLTDQLRNGESSLNELTKKFHSALEDKKKSLQPDGG